MTNAEKYLKEGTNINELASEMLHEYYEDTGITIPLLVCTFFDKETKPTLTEDERVILRNIKKKYKYIGKDGATLYVSELPLKNGYDTEENFYLFDHLFQFIKERRRIRDKGVVRTMTNGEKYLKDGVAEKFIKEINEGLDIAGGQFNIATFLNEQAKPTLTEDERVILRNLNEQIWEKIGRDKYGTLSLKTRTNDDDNFFNCCYGHLFQFIKERRRI